MAASSIRRRLVRARRDAPEGAEASYATTIGRDVLAVEAPLEIRLNGEPFTVTMRTPGDDFDLAAGFLVGEGYVAERSDIAGMRLRTVEDDHGRGAVGGVDVSLAPHVPPPDTSLARHVYTTSACGVCGTTSMDAVTKAATCELPAPAPLARLSTLLGLPDALRRAQGLFDETGGVHAAGLFTASGELLCLREDVGRHNAVDKVVGWALREGMLPLAGTILQVSGRASFELVQKARLAGVPVLSAVSAPSSLAVELADREGLTLAGFNRGRSVNIYTHEARIVTDDDAPASTARGAQAGPSAEPGAS